MSALAEASVLAVRGQPSLAHGGAGRPWRRGKIPGTPVPTPWTWHRRDVPSGGREGGGLSIFTPLRFARRTPWASAAGAPRPSRTSALLGRDSTASESFANDGNPLGRETHELQAALDLVRLDRLRKFLDVVIELLRDGIADRTDFVDDGIGISHDATPP